MGNSQRKQIKKAKKAGWDRLNDDSFGRPVFYDASTKSYFRIYKYNAGAFLFENSRQSYLSAPDSTSRILSGLFD